MEWRIPTAVSGLLSCDHIDDLLMLCCLFFVDHTDTVTVCFRLFCLSATSYLDPVSSKGPLCHWFRLSVTPPPPPTFSSPCEIGIPLSINPCVIKSQSQLSCPSTLVPCVFSVRVV